MTACLLSSKRRITAVFVISAALSLIIYGLLNLAVFKLGSTFMLVLAVALLIAGPLAITFLIGWAAALIVRA